MPNTIRGNIAREPDNALLRVTTLRHLAAFVQDLGKDHAPLFQASGVSLDHLNQPTAMIPYRAWINLLERTAAQFDCPSIGMILAAKRRLTPVFGPLEIVIYNSKTLGAAFQYCSKNVHVYSPHFRLHVESEAGSSRKFVRFESMLRDMPYQQQVFENSMSLAYHSISAISDQNASSKNASSREIWFMHEPISSLDTYREHFNVQVRFGMPSYAIILNFDDLEIEILDRNEHLFEMAVDYIEHKYPSADSALVADVRKIVPRLLPTCQCTVADVAKALGMHARTFQRRLQDQNLSFEVIKDDVRRDVVLHYLAQHLVPLTKITSMIGYSETSVLTRSCYRWFAKSPRHVRKQLTGRPSSQDKKRVKTGHCLQDQDI